MTIGVTPPRAGQYRVVEQAGEEDLPSREYDSNTNADVTWEGPEYAKLRPLVFGYAMFQTLFAACELDLFTKLSQKPGMTADEISLALNLPAHSTRLLLLTCSSMELVVKNGNRYYNRYPESRSAQYHLSARDNFSSTKAFTICLLHSNRKRPPASRSTGKGISTTECRQTPSSRSCYMR